MRDIDKMIRERLHLVPAVLTRMRERGILVTRLERDDLEQVARIALWQAIERYDPAKAHASLNTYAYGAMQRALLDYQRKVTRADGYQRGHGQIATIASIDAPLPEDPDLTICDTLAAVEHSATHADAVVLLSEWRTHARTLPPGQRAAAENLLDGSPLRLTELGARLGVTESRACQLTTMAREHLTEAA